MPKENIYQSLEVFYEKIDQCPIRNRQFNFFELVFVISGSGFYKLNDNKFLFSPNDLFLLTAKDKHEFDLFETGEFMVIRFGENYIKEFKWKSIDPIECLLYYASNLNGSILVNTEDKKNILSIIIHLKKTLDSQMIYYEDIVRNLVNIILVTAARNISLQKPNNFSPNTDKRLLQIIDYIQTNIRKPKLLKIAVIANEFGFSPTYLGSYFRRNCKESMQEYISSYKIRLIENRLMFSEVRINEIVDEFGFTDESHLNKFFKKHKSTSLRSFRMNK